MTIEIVPTQPENPNYSQRTRLAGTDYLLAFAYNDRDCRWYLSMALDDGTPLMSGKRIVAGTNLLDGVTHPRAPAGVLVAVDLPAYGDSPGEPRDPSFGDLGRPARHRLIFEADAV